MKWQCPRNLLVDAKYWSSIKEDHAECSNIEPPPGATTCTSRSRTCGWGGVARNRLKSDKCGILYLRINGDCERGRAFIRAIFEQFSSFLLTSCRNPEELGEKPSLRHPSETYQSRTRYSVSFRRSERTTVEYLFPRSALETKLTHRRSVTTTSQWTSAGTRASISSRSCSPRRTPATPIRETSSSSRSAPCPRAPRRRSRQSYRSACAARSRCVRRSSSTRR